MPKVKLVILDRDGVINRDSDAYVKSVDEFILIDGSADAIARLCQQGFTVAVATNQSGLARGYFTEQDLEAMHGKMQHAVKKAGGSIATIAYCPHGPNDGCQCRKPLAGLIDQIERSLGVNAEGSIMIGDSLRDLQAGVKKGCLPLLVKTGKGLKTLKQLETTSEAGLEKVPVFDDLSQAVTHIIQHYG
ncbi:MAG: D-glycero-beta-D-manno-heptose-1,7-bisphosphate 7-phosphatase [Cellvibrionaceae bacterium]|nr:D-glycero-beta-D-manno-heptose-1,7-bisphosphate 7-phosphatase [Cellvibrionaceae bacterium]|tara:strand:- start:22839 stop:23405 length:567 start_codon:yes stop_codon:yes gene_type:complete